MLLPYFLIFFGSVLVDCIPIFAPPAWMLMLLIMLKFNLNPWMVALIGTMGTVSGRLIYVSYIVPWLGKKSLGQQKSGDLKFLGKKLSQKGTATLFFVFIYSILPLSTTALFTAVGLARVRLLYVIPGFFLGNLVGDGILLITGDQAIVSIGDMYKGSFDPKNIIAMVAGLSVGLLFLFIDWRELLENKELKFKFKFWK